jgi:ribosome maturation protein Sdo1
MSTNSRYKTHRGREFNMSAFVEKNGEQKAVGNVPMNARGDIIDAKGNIKIPTQTISRAVSNLKNNESKSVSLKADDTIKPVKKLPPVEAEPAVVSTRDIVVETGPATEVEYDDGSIEIVPKESQE